MSEWKGIDCQCIQCLKIKWNHIKNGLPIVGEDVLFITNNNVICKGSIIPEMNRGETSNHEIAFWYVSPEEAYSENEVTHWTYLPELPKDE